MVLLRDLPGHPSLGIPCVGKICTLSGRVVSKGEWCVNDSSQPCSTTATVGSSSPAILLCHDTRLKRATSRRKAHFSTVPTWQG